VTNDQLLVDDPLAVYLSEIDQVPALTPVEEMECIEQVRSGAQNAESAAKRLVETHLALVVSIAERYCGGRVHILDLIQSGNSGLLHAVQNVGDFHYDRFSSYATPHIERAIAEAKARSQT
jgi:DNA-directed RNA polymerase sigma subunit (sigma70/sigma32)